MSTGATGYETLRWVLPQAGLVMQDNPGPMTLDGTNTWILRAPGDTQAIVVDPGDAGERHLGAVLAAAGEVGLVLLTHRHHDHAAAAPALHDRTGAPIRAFDPELCRGGDPLIADERIRAAGVVLRVVPTPGHTADSACFVLDDVAVLTGDTILGRGSTVVAHPDGALGPYLDSLGVLRAAGDLTVLPGHGPVLPSCAVIATAYLAHREQRLEQVRAAVAALGPRADAAEVVDAVYPDVDPQVRFAALMSVEAQLAYLRSAARVSGRGDPGARDPG